MDLVGFSYAHRTPLYDTRIYLYTFFIVCLSSYTWQPKMFNTDQGSQFTSQEWISELENRGIDISMDGKGCWRDNVFIERLWRSIKYEKLRLWSYSTVPELEGLVSEWMDFYNHHRRHQALENRRPWEVYMSYFEEAA